MSKLIFLGVTLLLICVDLGIKGCVENSIKKGEEHTFAKGKIIVRKVYNKGMALNLKQENPELVKKITAVAAIAVTVQLLTTLFRKRQGLRKLGLTFVVAGAWGNLVDRYLRGYVIDYIGFKCKWKKISDITFNFADFFIFFGSFLLILAGLFCGCRREKKR